MAKVQAKIDAARRELQEFGLAYPGAHLKSPWPDHADLAVNDKTFAYMSTAGEPFSISCKLPESSGVALMLPNAAPTAYGLGKSGWVTVSCEADEVPQVALFKAWIDESYRAQAPKKLLKTLTPALTAQAPLVSRKAKPKAAAAKKKRK